MAEGVGGTVVYRITVCSGQEIGEITPGAISKKSGMCTLGASHLLLGQHLAAGLNVRSAVHTWQRQKLADSQACHVSSACLVSPGLELLLVLGSDAGHHVACAAEHSCQVDTLQAAAIVHHAMDCV